MLTLDYLSNIPSLTFPVGLTLGSFDGVHLGHQYLLKKLRSFIGKQGTLVVLTFSNHPSDIIVGKEKTPFIYPSSYKLKILEQEDVDLTLNLPFTKELSQKPYDQFIEELYQQISFSYLLLGKGAAFGKDRQGNEANVTKLGQELGYQAIYLDKIFFLGEAYSSGRVRREILKGNLQNLITLLGRPYTLFGNVKGNKLDVSQLCLPPRGNYPVNIKVNHCTFNGLLRIDREVTVECKENLSECTIEIVFL